MVKRYLNRFIVLTLVLFLVSSPVAGVVTFGAAQTPSQVDEGRAGERILSETLGEQSSSNNSSADDIDLDTDGTDDRGSSGKDGDSKLSAGVKEAIDGSPSRPRGDSRVGIDGTRVAVNVEFTANRTARLERELARYGFNISNGISTATGFQAVGTVPKDEVTALADHPAVASISLPQPPVSTSNLTGRSSLNRSALSGAVTSEGVSGINADDAHANGVSGDDVKVAIIDFGFNEDNPEIASNVVEEKHFGADWRTEPSDTTHGTAAAEIVVDVAPNADVYLLNVYDYPHYDDAIDWAINNDIDVISSSVLFYDGVNGYKGEYGSAKWINKASRNGIVFVQSAGNSADDGTGNSRHWGGTPTNPDGNRWLNFEGSNDEINDFRSCGGYVTATLSWNDWPASDQDYDLYLIKNPDTNPEIVTMSINPQTGSEKPKEVLQYPLPNTCAEYGWAIRNFDASGGHHFDLFQYGSADRLEYDDVARSLNPEATAPGAVAVGAVNYYTTDLESYSSRGPTHDGRQKPDLVGPTDVSTSAYDRSFGGTSAATPHVAGAMALLESYNPTKSNWDHRSALENTADRLGYPPGNDRVGKGLIDVDAALRRYDDVPPTQVSNLRSTSHSTNSWTTDATVSVAWDPATDDYTGLDGYSVAWSRSPNTLPDRTVDVDGTSVTSPSLDDGEWYFHVRTVDNNGNWNGEAKHLGPFEIDTVAPHTQVPQSRDPRTWSNDNTVSLSASDRIGSSASIAPAGVESLCWKIDGGATNCENDDFAEVPVADGKHTIEYWATDAAGNVETPHETIEVWIDTSSPTVTDFRASNAGGQSVTVSFDADEPLTDVQVDLVSEEGTTVRTLTEGNFQKSGDTYTATVTLDSYGRFTATLATAEDAAGNDGANGASDGVTLCPAVVEDAGGDSIHATDPDGDGLCEDLNGNGQKDFKDVQLQFEAQVLQDEVLFSNPGPFDYNGNGEPDFKDVQLLFEEIVLGSTQSLTLAL